MSKSRHQLIDINQTPYYHCLSRCVRRAWICTNAASEDQFTDRNYEHRKAWAVKRLALLADVLAISVASFAIIYNYVHFLLRVDKQKVLAWDNFQVAKQWKVLYNWPLLVTRYMKGEASAAEIIAAKTAPETWCVRSVKVVDVPF